MIRNVLFSRFNLNPFRTFVTCTTLRKTEDRKMMLKTMPKKDEGSHGERAVELDVTGFSKICEFPQPDTPDRLFDNVPFKKLPIIYITSTKNNTKFNLTNWEGNVIYGRSCGVDGFKNCRKGTNVAAQVTADMFGKRILKMGYKTCRVCINGLGPGRMSSFKGLQQAGVNIISITDTTFIVDYPKERPPGAKSL